MPIRFRCVYCDKLLGIARRKAGAVVNCPQCNQPLIVPTPDPEPEPTAAGEPHKLFEGAALDDMLDEGQDQTYRGTGPGAGSAPPRAPEPPPTLRSVPVIQSAPTDAPAGLVLTTGRLILLFAFVLLLVVGAFVGGYLIGKG